MSVERIARRPNPLMNRLLCFVDGLSRWSGYAVSLAILGATIAIIIEIVMRYGFRSPTAWGFELPLYLVAASYLLGGAYAQIQDGHVRVDLFYAQWSARTRAWVDLLVTWPVFLLGIGILAYAAFNWTTTAYHSGATTGTRWGPPLWPIRGLLLLGSTLLFLQGLASIVRTLRTLRNVREEYDDES